MMSFRAALYAVILLFLTVSSVSAIGQTADHVVISEILIDGVNEQLASNNDEFVEIYNPTLSSIDVGGWTIDYRSATSTSFTNKYKFPSGTIIQPHKYFLFGGGGVSNRDNNPAPSSTLGLSNTGGAVFVRNSSGTVVDLIGWGTASSGNYEGTVAVKPAQGVSLERKAKSTSDASSMGAGGADEFDGNGLDSDNNAADFVQRTTPQPQSSSDPAEPSTAIVGSGIGSATITPSSVSAATISDFSIKVLSDEKDTIETVIVVVPAGFKWAGSVSALTVSGSGAAGALVSVDQDTIQLKGAAVTNSDTVLIVIKSVSVPDSAMSANFVIKTAAAGVSPSEVSSKLTVTLTKLIRIIDLHVNDSQGVPAQPYQEGATVTVSGIITAVTSTTSTSLFLQDATAGVNMFSYTYFPVFQEGDSVTFTGVIKQFRGTTEVMPDSGKWTIHSHGRPLPKPLLLTAADVNQTFNDDYSEPNEGRLVRLNGVTYDAANQTFTDATGTTGGYISSSWTIPSGTFDVVGILKQFKPGLTSTMTPPYTENYEVVPRTQEDIITHPGPTFTQAPEETEIQPNSVVIAFKTGTASNVVVRYGTTDAYRDTVTAATPDTVGRITLSGLAPATVYHYQVAATDLAGTNQTGDAIFSTASPVGTTGTIDVFFSKSVNTSVARGQDAQTMDISSKFISRVNAAKYSIDVALYSLSGTVGTNIANALIAAKGRGVKVRMIVENENFDTAPMNTMKSSDIPFITDTFDPVNAGNGLMHNKFAIFDFRDTSSFTDDWVWTGSWNATDPGTNNDAQNALEIQDKSLANAYTMEFNEMWGSSTDSPNSSLSRFGSRKTDNTPHRFNINGIPVELYFSPSDQTTLHILSALEKAKESINVCMLTFTRSDLAQALVSAKSAGEKVRVILDNNVDSGNQFAFLKSGNVDIHLKGEALTGLLHHKYALIDADDPRADATVITGSHNWSNSAETSNNENTLIIHDTRVANLYLQEFKSRYLEAGGTDAIELGVKRTDGDVPEHFGLGQNFPNPFNPTTHIGFQIANTEFVSLKIYDVLGRKVRTLVNEVKKPGRYDVQFDAGGLPSGVYFYKVQAGPYTSVKKMILLK